MAQFRRWESSHESPAQDTRTTFSAPIGADRGNYTVGRLFGRAEGFSGQFGVAGDGTNGKCDRRGDKGSEQVESQRVVYEVLRRDVPHINLFSVW
jgi:hypothetical protein